MLAALCALLLAPAPSLAQTPSVVLLDWQEGWAPLGLELPVEGVNARTWTVWVDGCHRQLFADLLYEPDGAEVSAGPATVGVGYTFELSVTGPNGTLSRRILSPGYGHGLGETPAAGLHDVRLSLEQGAAVNWTLRLRGWEVAGEAECVPSVLVSEIEANPPGVDLGAEWVELANAATYDVDLSGWTLETTHGTIERLILADGASIPRGGRLVVALPGQFLDNEDESVLLLRPDGSEADRTEPRSDEEDDGRSWQRLPDGNWTFAAATPGSAPP